MDRRSTRAIFFSPLTLPRIVLPDGSFRHNARRQNKNKKIKERVVWHFYSTRKSRVRRETIDPLCSSVPRLPIFIPARSNGTGNTRKAADPIHEIPRESAAVCSDHESNNRPRFHGKILSSSTLLSVNINISRDGK